MTDCVFCKIIAGDIPTDKVFENDKVIAFKDMSPKAPIHYLFVPKDHYESTKTFLKPSSRWPNVTVLPTVVTGLSTMWAETASKPCPTYISMS